MPLRQSGLESMLEHRQPELVEPGDLGTKSRGIGQIGVWGAIPHGQRGAELFAGLRGVVVRQRGRAAHCRFELDRVDRGHAGPQDIATCGRLDGSRLTSECLAQVGDVDLHGLAGSIGRFLVPPDLVDEPVGGDGLVGSRHEKGQHEPLLGAAQHRGLAVDGDLERSQYLNPHDGETSDVTRRHPVSG